MDEIVADWEVPLDNALLCLPHGIIYVPPNICGLCFFLSAENKSNRYWARIGDDTADPLIDFDTTSVGNGIDSPNIVDQAINVEEYFRRFPDERTRLNIPSDYHCWVPRWADLPFLRLRIPIQRPLKIETPRQIGTSMTSPPPSWPTRPLSLPSSPSRERRRSVWGNLTILNTGDTQTPPIITFPANPNYTPDGLDTPPTPGPRSPTRVFDFASPRRLPSPPTTTDFYLTSSSAPCSSAPCSSAPVLQCSVRDPRLGRRCKNCEDLDDLDTPPRPSSTESVNPFFEILQSERVQRLYSMERPETTDQSSRPSTPPGDRLTRQFNSLTINSAEQGAVGGVIEDPAIVIQGPAEVNRGAGGAISWRHIDIEAFILVI